MKQASFTSDFVFIPLRSAALNLRALTLGLLLLFVASGAFSQKVRFSISSEQITTDESVQVTLELSEVSGTIQTPRWPNVNGLVGAGNSTNQSFINGRMSVAFGKTYYPQAPGTYTIPSFTYSVAGKNFQSPDFKVVVKKGNGKPKQQQQQQTMNPFDAFFGDPFSNRPREELKFQETKADYFLSINLDKDSCFVGEQVRGEVVLYINERDYGKINLDGRDIVDMQQKIKNTGFWQEIIEFDEVPMNRVEVNGKRYIAYTLYQTILFPIRSGKIDFKGINLNAKKLYVATNASIMDQFTGKSQKYEPIVIKANERSLMVRELPKTDLPEAEMVGDFRMEASISDSTANTGDNLEVKVTVSGNGNIAMMNLPEPSFPESFRNDGSSNDYKSKTSAKGFAGEKTYKYYLVPTRPGKFDLGPIKFYYFDPKTRRYDSLSVASLPVMVTGEDLADKLMRDKQMDSFYDTYLTKADPSLRKEGGNLWYIWALFIAGIVSSTGYSLFIRKKASQKEE